MTPGELTARVTFDTCAVSAGLAALGGLVAGASVAGGVLAGRALAVLSFRWLVVRVGVVEAAAGESGSAWSVPTCGGGRPAGSPPPPPISTARGPAWGAGPAT